MIKKIKKLLKNIYVYAIIQLRYGRRLISTKEKYEKPELSIINDDEGPASPKAVLFFILGPIFLVAGIAVAAAMAGVVYQVGAAIELAAAATNITAVSTQTSVV